jgi:hypothetical protein
MKTTEGPMEATSAWHWNEYGSDHAEITRRTVIQKFGLPLLAAAMLHFNPVTVSFVCSKPDTGYLGGFVQPSLK